MGGWMNGWLGEWVGGWMDWWMNGWVDGWTGGWIDWADCSVGRWSDKWGVKKPRKTINTSPRTSEDSSDEIRTFQPLVVMIHEHFGP